MTDAEALAEAERAATHWGGGAARLIRNRENAVFEIALPMGRAALRLHRTGYQTEAAIRSELWWMGALAGAGLPVPRPLSGRSGDVVVRLASGRLASAIAWVDGDAMGDAGVPLAGSAAEQAAVHYSLGRLIAGVHRATDSMTLPGWFERPRWDRDGLLGEAPFWGRFWDHPALRADERALLCHARDHAAAWLGAFGGPDTGLIHADVLRENVLVGADGLTLIDFDDCGSGYRLYDLGTALSQNLAEPALPQIAAALLEGYSAIRPLSPEASDAVPLFTLLRCCASVGWTMPRLHAGDPRHRVYIERATRAADLVLRGVPLFA